MAARRALYLPMKTRVYRSLFSARLQAQRDATRIAAFDARVRPLAQYSGIAHD